MLSIPHGGRLGGVRRLALGNGSSGNGDEDDGESVSLPVVRELKNGAEISPCDEDHFVRPYADAIRDRLLFYFELNQMVHKPKLVALAGCGDGAGTSTLAAAVASSFASAGDGKILLVDMNSNEEEGLKAQFEGLPSGSLAQMVQSSTGHSASAHDTEKNLYLATVTSRGEGPRQFAPKKLYDLLPQFKASEFDYIIFDMPPISPTSPTVAMAGFMDKVLLVLDAEKTNREVIKRGYAELISGKADVSCICNRVRQRGPKWMMDEPL